jgi:putative transposase
MHYHPHVIYHVYNQSINYETLFKTDANYQLFLRKLRKHLLPHAAVFCYCLMPDHFHLLLKPTELGCANSPATRFIRSTEEGDEICYQQNLSHAIKTILSSYSQAINRQSKRRGSLFKSKTKAKPGYHGFYPDAADFAVDEPFTRFIPYLRVCYHYIHDNPVKAGLVTDPLEWAYSSALDYAGYRDSGLCDFELTAHLLGIERQTLRRAA